MELTVTILNFLRYEDKLSKQPKVRIGYINNDKTYISNNTKVKGYPELSVYLDDNGLWDNLKLDMCGDVATFLFEKVPNPSNPLKDYTKLVSIKSKHGNIDIL